MSESFIQFAFEAGVISPALRARGDLEKYDLALSQGTNWFIDYRGGAATRPGTQFLDFVEGDARLVPFQYNSTLGNAYVLVFGHQYVRFVQDGGYVLEASKSITNITSASPAVVTSAAHGFSNGDWVSISGAGGMAFLDNLTFQVSAATTNTFAILDPEGKNIDTSTLTYTSGGTVSRIYTVVTPYSSSDLPSLSFNQRQNSLYITSTAYAPRTLTRTTHTNWSLATITFVGNSSPVSSISLTASGSGSAGTVVTVTSVDTDGNESRIGEYAIVTGMVNYSTTAGSLRISWGAVTGAVSYNIYRSIIFPTATSELHIGQDLGYIGSSRSTAFTDNNIVPDFTRSPPTHADPFANGAITQVDVTAGGSGYSQTTSTVSVSGGGGSGFVGKPIVDSSGVVIGVIILDPGSGYSSPVVSFGGPGSGATATATARPTTGNYPATSARVHQRRIFAGTTNAPIDLFATRPGSDTNFDSSQLAADNDPFNLTLDASSITPIRYVMPNYLGMLILAEDTTWQLRTTNDLALTVSTAKAEIVTANGSAQLPPIKIDRDIIYVEDKGSAVRTVRPGNLPTVQENIDLSIFSSHYFTQSNPIESWAYAPVPYRLIWAQRQDGSLLSFTYVREQNIYAWTDHYTEGQYKSVAAIDENNTSVVYLIVHRTIGSTVYRFLEKFTQRETESVEDIWAVDCGLATTDTFPAATITVGAATGDGVAVTASAGVFSSGDVGKILRGGGGRAKVASFVSSSSITIDIEMAFTQLNVQTGTPVPLASGEWTLNPVVSAVSGLDYIEGQTVDVLADGNVEAQKTVTNGSITLDNSSSRVIVGLPYSAELHTLPFVSPKAVIEEKRKRVVSVALNLHKARGLFVAAGSSPTTFYEMKERTTEGDGVPIGWQTGIHPITVTSDWSADCVVAIKKQLPLHATVLGLISTLEVGDNVR